MIACRLTSSLAAALTTAALLPTGAETYDSWSAQHFTPSEIAAGLAAPHGDHDRDGCPNILEYCGNTLPMDCHSSLALTWGFDHALGEATVRIPFRTDRQDIEYQVLVSDDLVEWLPRAVLICPDPAPTYHLNGYRYVRVGVQPRAGMMLDSDQDGLSDHFEESLIATDPGDAFHHLGQVLPEDDFDGDGIRNIDEDANHPVSGVIRRPPTIAIAAVSCATNGIPPPPPTSLLVHTILK